MMAHTIAHSQILLSFKRVQQIVRSAVYKLLPKPLKLLLSQLRKFCWNNTNYIIHYWLCI